MIDPEQIIEAADPALVRRVSPWRQVFDAWPSLVALAGLPWLWAEAGEHGHRTAVAAGLAVLVPALLGMWWSRGAAPPTLRSSRSRAIGGARMLGEFAVIIWLVQREELPALGSVVLGWAVVCVAAGVPASIARAAAALGALLPGRRTQARVQLARSLARSSDGPAVAILEAWRGRLPTPLAGELEILAEVETLPKPNPGRGRIARLVWRGLGMIVPPYELGPGVRRQLPGGDWLLAQVGGHDGDVTVTNSDGLELELGGIWRRVSRTRRWGAHGRTAVVARIAAGPTYHVTSTFHAGGEPPSPRRQHIACPARGRAPLLPGDEGVLGGLVLRASRLSTPPLTPWGVVCLVPGDEPVPAGAEPVLEPVFAPSAARRGVSADRLGGPPPATPRTPGRPEPFGPLVDATRERLGEDGQLFVGPCPRLEGLPAITMRAAAGGRAVEVARLPGSHVVLVIAEDLPLCIRFDSRTAPWGDAAAVAADLLLHREEHPVAIDGRKGIAVGKAVVWPAREAPVTD